MKTSRPGGGQTERTSQTELFGGHSAGRFFSTTPHAAARTAAAQVGDAKGIRRKITQMKIGLDEGRASESCG